MSSFQSECNQFFHTTSRSSHRDVEELCSAATVPIGIIILLLCVCSVLCMLKKCMINKTTLLVIIINHNDAIINLSVINYST